MQKDYARISYTHKHTHTFIYIYILNTTHAERCYTQTDLKRKYIVKHRVKKGELHIQKGIKSVISFK